MRERRKRGRALQLSPFKGCRLQVFLYAMHPSRLHPYHNNDPMKFNRHTPSAPSLDYLNRINIALGALPPLADPFIPRIQHRTPCRMGRGGTACRCCPRITIDTPPGRIEVGPRGEVINRDTLN